MEVSDYELKQGDCLDVLRTMPSESVHLVVTSPPYNKVGLEGKQRTLSKNETWRPGRNISYDGFDDNMPESEYQAQQIEVLNECFRVLVDGGSICYNHKVRVTDFKAIHPIEWLLKTKFNLRQQIVWNRNGTASRAPIRFAPTTELIFWMFKGDKPRVFNGEHFGMGEVWSFGPDIGNAHPAPFPEQLPRRCILALSNKGDAVLDPYSGSGTTVSVAIQEDRNAIGIELNPAYIAQSRNRISNTQPRLLFDALETQP